MNPHDTNMYSLTQMKQREQEWHDTKIAIYSVIALCIAFWMWVQ